MVAKDLKKISLRQCKGLTIIEDFTFNGCSGLTSIELPSSLEVIGICAFQYCYSLTSIRIPKKTYVIYQYAFHYCYNLKTVIINENIYTESINYDDLGYILYYAHTVYVPKRLVDDSTLIEGTYFRTYFTQKELIGRYYVYVKKQQYVILGE